MGKGEVLKCLSFEQVKDLAGLLGISVEPGFKADQIRGIIRLFWENYPEVEPKIHQYVREFVFPKESAEEDWGRTFDLPSPNPDAEKPLSEETALGFNPETEVSNVNVADLNGTEDNASAMVTAASTTPPPTSLGLPPVTSVVVSSPSSVAVATSTSTGAIPKQRTLQVPTSTAVSSSKRSPLRIKTNTMANTITTWSAPPRSQAAYSQAGTTNFAQSTFPPTGYAMYPPQYGPQHQNPYGVQFPAPVQNPRLAVPSSGNFPPTAITSAVSGPALFQTVPTGFWNPPPSQVQPWAYGSNVVSTQMPTNPVNVPTSSTPGSSVSSNPGFLRDLVQALDHNARRRPENRMSIKFLKECESRRLKFSGKCTERVSIFLEEIDEVIEFLRLSDDDVLAGFARVLDGPALTYHRYSKNRYATWEDLKTDFREAFGILEYDPLDEAKMDMRTMQRGETIDTYVATMSRINRFLKRPRSTPELLERLLRNLTPEYRIGLKDEIITTVNDLIRAGRKFERLRISNWRYEPPPEMLRSDPIYGLENLTFDTRRRIPPANVSSIWALSDEGTVGDDGQNSVDDGMSYAAVAQLPPRILPRPNSEARNVGRDAPNRSNEIKCYNCNELGHIARDCPNPRRQSTRSLNASPTSQAEN